MPKITTLPDAVRQTKRELERWIGEEVPASQVRKWLETGFMARSTERVEPLKGYGWPK